MTFILNFLSLDDIKAQCSIEPDETAYDGLLQMYGAAAEQDICDLINRSAVEILDEWTNIPANLYAAMLSRTATRFKYREDVTPDAVNDAGICRAIAKYVRLVERVTND